LKFILRMLSSYCSGVFRAMVFLLILRLGMSRLVFDVLVYNLVTYLLMSTNGSGFAPESRGWF
jgi:hypothetical protein